MSLWTNVFIVAHVLVALAIIGLVLLQHGKGADMGSGFGGGASSSLFGATGSANFLSRATAVLATLFFLLSLALAYLATNRAPQEGGGVMDAVRQQQQQQPQPQQKPPAGSAEKPAAVPPPAPAEGSKDKAVPQ
ncbi:MAG TPA: preprotein translocase subunit SecG [Burkholderiales bacterium]|nr:preprotein translocase subunit SecG [Burkholderiales bacterium]